MLEGTFGAPGRLRDEDVWLRFLELAGRDDRPLLLRPTSAFDPAALSVDPSGVLTYVDDEGVASARVEVDYGGGVAMSRLSIHPTIDDEGAKAFYLDARQLTAP